MYVNCRDMVGVNWWNVDKQTAYFTDSEKVTECKKRSVSAVVYMGKILEELKIKNEKGGLTNGGYRKVSQFGDHELR